MKQLMYVGLGTVLCVPVLLQVTDKTGNIQYYSGVSWYFFDMPVMLTLTYMLFGFHVSFYGPSIISVEHTTLRV